jgi:hypothetical protein
MPWCDSHIVKALGKNNISSPQEHFFPANTETFQASA